MRPSNRASGSTAEHARTIAAALALAAMCAVVFAMSAQQGSTSGGLSTKIVNAIIGVVVSGYDQMSAAEQALWFDRVHFAVRKTAHFSEYALVGMLALNALRQLAADRQWGARLRRILQGRPALLLTSLFSWLFATFYAATDELHQAFVPGRACAFTDVCIDSLGALFGIALICLVLSLRRRATPRTR